jgi:hypothetical protein
MKMPKRYDIQPERDMLRNEAGDGTRYEACDAKDAEIWAVYASDTGEPGSYELVDDFPTFEAAQQFVKEQLDG